MELVASFSENPSLHVGDGVQGPPLFPTNTLRFLLFLHEFLLLSLSHSSFFSSLHPLSLNFLFGSSCSSPPRLLFLALHHSTLPFLSPFFLFFWFPSSTFPFSFSFFPLDHSPFHGFFWLHSPKETQKKSPQTCPSIFNAQNMETCMCVGPPTIIIIIFFF